MLRLVYPNLGPYECSATFHGHWRTIHKAFQRAKEDTLKLIREQWATVEPIPHPMIRLTFGLPDVRKRDWANLISRCKPMFDALTDAGVIPGDSVFDYQMDRPAYFISRRNPQTVIEVWSAPPSDQDHLVQGSWC